MKTIYEVVAENLQNVGGPMGSDTSAPDYFREFFLSVEKAKARCRKHYTTPGRNNAIQMRWVRRGKVLETDDLLWVMYSIEPIKIQDAK
jgi:hypothetical protein